MQQGGEQRYSVLIESKSRAEMRYKLQNVRVFWGMRTLRSWKENQDLVYAVMKL